MTTTPTPPRIATTHVTGRRVVATVLDGLLFGLAYIALAGSVGTVASTGPWSWRADMPVAGTVAYVVAIVAYYVLMEGLLGQTVGKLVCGICVVDPRTGSVPGLGKAAVRTVLRLVDGLLDYLVAFVVVLRSSRRRRLGDMVAGTLVVRSPAEVVCRAAAKSAGGGPAGARAREGGAGGGGPSSSPVPATSPGGVSGEVSSGRRECASPAPAP